MKEHIHEYHQPKGEWNPLCKHCGLMKSTIEYIEKAEQISVGQYIDPIVQVFMDFYAETHMENLRGETKMIIYQDWAGKARKVMSEEINNQYDLVPKDDYPYPSPQQIDYMMFDNKFIGKNKDELKDLGHTKEDFLK